MATVTDTTDRRLFVTDEGLRWMQQQLTWERSLRRLRDPEPAPRAVERAVLEAA